MIPFGLLLGYFLWMMHASREIGESLAESLVKINQVAAEAVEQKRIRKEEEMLYKNLLIENQKLMFTGTEEKEGDIYSTKLHIQTLDSTHLTFQLETFRNQILEEKWEGVAELDSRSYGQNRWRIEDHRGVKQAAFRFVEKRDDCELEILLAKRKYYFKEQALITRYCPDKTENLGVIMKFSWGL